MGAVPHLPVLQPGMPPVLGSTRQALESVSRPVMGRGGGCLQQGVLGLKQSGKPEIPLQNHRA